MPRVFRYSAIVLSLLIASQATAVTYDQVDDFQDPNAGPAGWRGAAGGTARPLRVADGGPGGAGDAYLRIATLRYHLATKNTDQWTGNYLAAGIGAIEMDLKHIRPGTDAVEIHLAPRTGRRLCISKPDRSNLYRRVAALQIRPDRR